MVYRYPFIAAAAMCLMLTNSAAPAQEHKELEYAPAPIDNPLKGLVPYAGSRAGQFPHSMEFQYIALADLVKGEDTYDWTALEDLLNACAARGHQTVFRVYLEFPGKSKVIPDYLVAAGLKINRYLNTNTQPFPPTAIETPDYNDSKLRKCLSHFVTSLGKKYDGDPRIGFITAGLLGSWGEWHDYPRNDLFASRQVQEEVMRAYEAAFKITPILLRYPTGQSDAKYAPNAGRHFGYHDDSFAWATLDTGKANESWFFVSKLNVAGSSAIGKWKKWPIGGEIRPEAWGKVFDRDPADPQIQNFAECVNQTHVSWLMDSGMFRDGASEDRQKRARNQVGKMGYEFTVKTVTVSPAPHALVIATLLQNTGIAPFYYRWNAEFALVNSSGTEVKRLASRNSLKGLLPGTSVVWKDRLDTINTAPGKYLLQMRVPNALPNGVPVKFANKAQDKDRDGWLSLTEVEVK